MQTLGFSLVVAISTAAVFHMLLSYPTQNGWMPDPFFRLRIAGMHRAIHASDSHIYNRRGIMDRVTFDDIFKMYGDPIEETLTLRQTLTLWRNNHDLYDIFGTWVNLGKWLAAWIVLKDESGKMRKTDLLDLIDGSYFQRVFSAEADTKRSSTPLWSPIHL
ncbi:hypothetical protein M407DRAFT_120845 [Tulasnella calospora MUT 4182]|uniref:Caleosin-domain-containing protein n=1 Tax=Tulasnella calospora MUT 4182 TaxID=1051891 RepID=A0A0C3KKY5_9AGAM|nr:hypothetical protein M407DRAFT_120845 [Tulasnella calospora MUT 4182]